MPYTPEQGMAAARSFIDFANKNAVSETSVGAVIAFDALYALLGRKWAVGTKYADSFTMKSFAPPAGYVGDAWPVMRFVGLGLALYELQQVPGFEERLVEWRNHKALEAVAAEAWCALVTLAAGVDLSFVDANAGRGTYDMDLLDGGQVRGAGEIKSRASSSEYRGSTVLGRLRRAASQLPSDRPGFIWMHVPSTWLELERQKPEVGPAVDEIFRSYGRVAAVTFVVETVMEGHHAILGKTTRNTACRLADEWSASVCDRLEATTPPREPGQTPFECWAREAIAERKGAPP